MNDAQIKHMVNRFLGWKLPQDFEPDSGITFNRYVNGKERRQDWWPVGTNLFTATQAETMIKHMVEGLPAAQLEGSDGK